MADNRMFIVEGGAMQPISSFDIAYLCNDLDNIDKYRVVGDNAYYLDQLIFEYIKLTETKDANGKIDRSVSMLAVNPARYVEGKIEILL